MDGLLLFLSPAMVWILNTVVFATVCLEVRYRHKDLSFPLYSSSISFSFESTTDNDDSDALQPNRDGLQPTRSRY